MAAFQKIGGFFQRVCTLRSTRQMSLVAASSRLQFLEAIEAVAAVAITGKPAHVAEPLGSSSTPP